MDKQRTYQQFCHAAGGWRRVSHLVPVEAADLPLRVTWSRWSAPEPGPAACADCVVVKATGELDLRTAPLLRGCARTLVDATITAMVIDLTGLTFIDSTGLGTLVGIHKSLAACEGRLAVAASAPAITRVLEITGLSAVLHLRTTVEQAAAAISGLLEAEGTPL